jgi:predicted AlkP superfamily pyrophosphatase or phosphodiesterase
MEFEILFFFTLFSLTLCLPFYERKSNLENKRYPLLLISLDGFRADKFEEFIKENPTSNLRKFAKEGIKADFIKPSFPSLTFANHWTLVTGHYPETHGI